MTASGWRSPPAGRFARAAQADDVAAAALEVLRLLARGVADEDELSRLKANPIVRDLYDMTVGASGPPLDSLTLHHLRPWRGRPGPLGG